MKGYCNKCGIKLLEYEYNCEYCLPCFDMLKKENGD